MIRLFGGAVCVGVGLAIASTEFVMTYPSPAAFVVGLGIAAVGGLLILDWHESEVQ